MDDNNKPLSLKEAARLAFPYNGITAQGLKTEIGKGRLIANKDPYSGRWSVTLGAIEDMRQLIREEAAANRPAPPPPLVYVVGYGPYVKIGFTSEVRLRLRSIQAGVPEKLQTYALLEGLTLADEKALHRRFSDHRIHYEWFRLEGELAAWIAGGCKL